MKKSAEEGQRKGGHLSLQLFQPLEFSPCFWSAAAPDRPPPTPGPPPALAPPAASLPINTE